ncbi:hypothetical protein QBC47DRAFT_341437 [Echria macrotheca]|uniref:Uncharacterized protein n=1 Tax=Echria macrotheca TaxID=438768 RepID=A0AAJ0FCN8_9PEZI|nr:hypothetical protein QBC47DRAFT_341437 [Echria macrotheca]
MAMATTLLAPAILLAFWLWGYIDSKISARYSAQYKPYPIRQNPTYTPSRDVSVVSCMLNPEPLFISRLASWLRNDPSEVVLSTRAAFVGKVQAALDSCDFDTSKVRIVVAPDSLPGFRGQMVTGLRAARCPIIAKVDGHILWGDEYLVHMLASFEDPSVGASGGAMTVFIAPERQNPESVTPAEVAATKMLFGAARCCKTDIFAAARFRWIIAGGSVLYRAALVTSDAFVAGFMNDIWHSPFGRRTRLDTGDDTFISRWIARQGYINAAQQLPATDVSRVPKRSAHAFVMQLMRWERSTIQSHLRTVFCAGEVPQVWSHPLVARKTIERLLRDVIAAVHVCAWVVSLLNFPFFTVALLWYYVSRIVSKHRAFFAQYPYMSRHWWAAVGVDYLAIILSPRVWLTLGTEEWHLGEKVSKKTT